jgi:hypothetical protein
MSTLCSAALVQPVKNPYFHQADKRTDERHLCSLEATSHPLEVGETLSWGAQVTDISQGGLRISLCYPFRLGTYLAVDLQSPTGMVRTLMVRVVHVHDQRDGQWRLGCEFVKPLSESDMELFL